MVMQIANRANETTMIRSILRELGNQELRSCPQSLSAYSMYHKLYFETANTQYAVFPCAVLFRTKNRKGREWYGYDRINSGLFRVIRIAFGDKLESPSAEITDEEITFRFKDGSVSKITPIGAGIIQIVKPDARVLMLKYDRSIDKLVSVSFIVEPIQVIEEVV
jgi:hypothetical protein